MFLYICSMTDSGVNLIRRDPPPIRHNSGSRSSEWAEVHRHLKSHPGEWFVVKRYKNAASASSTASYVKKTYEGLETKVRTEDGGTDLYARYTGSV